MLELYQDNLVDLLLPKNSKPQKLKIEKNYKVHDLCHLHSFHFVYNTSLLKSSLYIWFSLLILPSFSCLLALDVLIYFLLCYLSLLQV
jgi:hypothetical protein